VTFERARRFQDVLAGGSQDEQFAYETIFDASSFWARRRSRKKFRMLKRIGPRVRRLLWHGEKVRYLMRARGTPFWARYLAGAAIGVLNRRALIVTDRRIILLQIGNRHRPGELVEQIRYAAVDSLTGTPFGSVRIRCATGGTVTLTNIPRADRAFLVRLIEFTRSQIPREESGLEDLCSYCYKPVAGRPPACPHCRGAFKSVRRAALLSLVFPGIGDWYLGHHVIAAIEIAAAAIGWMWLIGLRLKSLVPAADIVAAAAVYFLVAHGTDALVTRQVARLGLYPAVTRKLGLRASLVQFATVTGVFLVAIVGALVFNEMSAYAEYNRTELERRERLAANPAVQQARAVQAARVEQVTVAALAERIATDTAAWSVVVLYSIHTERSRMIFPQLVALHREYQDDNVDFKLYSVDNDEDLPDLPVFLARQQAAFTPARLMPWKKGDLGAAMSRVGVHVGTSWAIPLVVLLDRQPAVVWQAQGLTDLDQLEALLAERVDTRK
jgi:hypothetical protein